MKDLTTLTKEFFFTDYTTTLLYFATIKMKYLTQFT